ncbi:MAG: transglycosylase SLT domain-containing protein [Rhizobacter sp.]
MKSMVFPYFARLAAWPRTVVAVLLVASSCLPARAWAAIEPFEPPALWRALRSEAQAQEQGLGVPKDGAKAAALYCQAAKLGDPESQFHLGWIYAYGRGVPGDDRLAAFFFRSAADQGIEQARTMLAVVGEPEGELPACLRNEVKPVPVAIVAAAPVKPPPIQAPKSIADLVNKLAPGFKLEPQLVLAIIKAESNFDELALSPKKAMGLMQLIPETAARFNVQKPYDAKQNVSGGMAYLRWLLAYFEGDVALVAAAYNAGEGTVERYRGVPPFGETQAYVARVLKAVGRPTHPFDAGVTGPSPKLAQIKAVATPSPPARTLGARAAQPAPSASSRVSLTLVGNP